MLYRRILLSLLFVCVYSCSFAGIFIVTSKADAGAGTLRDALTKAAANGSGQKDFINFNLPGASEADRTITLESELPILPANIVIDGTTQAGIKFGVSGSKVKVVNTYGIGPNVNAIFKGDNSGDIEIAGLFILSGNGQSALYMTKSNNVFIHHCLVFKSTVTVTFCKKFTFSNNMVGLDATGTTFNEGGVSAFDIDNIIIGGSPTAGNLINSDIRLGNTYRSADWQYLVSYNKVATDYSGTKSYLTYNTPARIHVSNGGPTTNPSGQMHGTISNNLVANVSSYGIFAEGTGDALIQANTVNTDKTGTVDFSKFDPDGAQGSTGIYIGFSTNAIIGGTTPADGNIIGYVSNPILEQHSGYVIITQNSVFCSIYTDTNVHGIILYPKKTPLVRVLSITANKVSGTATAGARVELFYDDEGKCKTCDPRHFLGFTMADAQGNWTYNGVVPTNNIIASSIFNKETSRFTKAAFNKDNLQVTQPECGENGAIKGITFYNAAGAKWINEAGDFISASTDIDNLPPGRYKFKVGSDACGKETDWIELFDYRPQINIDNATILQPSCNVNGSIKNIKIKSLVGEALDIKWYDPNGAPIANTADVSNLLPGKYTLTVTGKDHHCVATHSVTLANVVGPNIDETKISKTAAACNQSTGSITGIQVSGTAPFKYSWKNEQNAEVATTKDLLNKPAGKYRLEFTDGSSCGPVVSSVFEITETNGISLSYTDMQIILAACNKPTGSITNIKVIGATKYAWENAAGEIVSNSLNLKDVPSGDYKLTASNNFCSKTSPAIKVLEAPGTTYNFTSEVKDACNPLSVGTIRITSISPAPAAWRWVNAQDVPIPGPTSELIQREGTYRLYVTDAAGCETLLGMFDIIAHQPLDYTDNVVITNDQCSLKTGSITGFVISGGIPPYTYQWLDAAGNTVSTALNATGLGAGTYTLLATDAFGCTIHLQIPKTIINEDNGVVPAPRVNNVDVCSPGEVILRVTTPDAGSTYRLYTDDTGVSAIGERADGIFTVPVTANKSFFVTRAQGACESPKTEVKVTVGLSNLIIANTITPNGDGINDFWVLKDIEQYPACNVQLFNRSGQKVFESTGYGVPFNGTLGGQNLPMGTYYYIIRLNSTCKLISGHLNLLR